MFQHPPNPNTTPENKGVDIHLVSAWALGKLCWDRENVTFRILVNEALESPMETLDPSHPLWAQRVDRSPINNTQDGILEEYQEFMDVFSAEKANTLAPYWPYDLQIKLAER